MSVIRSQSTSEKPPIPPDTEPVEIELRFDLTLLTLREQNAFLAAMDQAGFGWPSEGRYTVGKPSQLINPLTRATFTFSEENPGNAEASIDEAKGIAAKHRATLAAVRFVEGTVLRVWPLGLPQS